MYIYLYIQTNVFMDIQTKKFDFVIKYLNKAQIQI